MRRTRSGATIPGWRLRFSSMAVLWIVAPDSLALAGGFGAYLEYPHGRQTIDYEQFDDDFTNHRFGVGFVYDSNVARDARWNWRASAGYLRTENTVDDEAHGGAIDLAAGFGVIRTRDLRVWVAPTVRWQIDFYENPDAEVLDLGIGGGLRLGVNWHMASRVSIAPSVAYQYLYVRESVEDDFGKDEFDGGEHLVTVRLTFLFRSDADVYAPAFEAR